MSQAACSGQQGGGSFGERPQGSAVQVGSQGSSLGLTGKGGFASKRNRLHQRTRSKGSRDGCSVNGQESEGAASSSKL